LHEVQAARAWGVIDWPYFLVRRPGGGVTELRTHGQGRVGAAAIGVQMDCLTPASAVSVLEDQPSA